MINETLARQIGYENVVGQEFQHKDLYITMFPVERFKIICMVKDFHFKSLRSKIEPPVPVWNPDWFGYVNIKIAKGQIAPAMKEIKNIMNEFSPGVLLEYQFIDESFDRMYKSDERMGKLLIYFTVLAILMSILGLIGVVTYLTKQRTKEIAIRKTLGARVNSIKIKLTREYSWLVIIANGFAIPVVICIGYKWLEEFAYITSMGPGIFIIGALVSIGIAFVTVLSITSQAANSNPARSLRYE